MSNDPESLIYDCTFNIFLGRAFLPKLKNLQERQRANRWLRKLQEVATKTIEAMKQRNVMVFKLATCIQNGALEAPFDADPPIGPLKTCFMARESGDGGPEPGAACQGDVERNFLLPRPLPKVGAYCYLAVLNPNLSEEEDELE